MHYVVVDTKTRCKVFETRHGDGEFKSEAAAKASRTRMLKSTKDRRYSNPEQLVVMNNAEYRKQVPMKRVKNLLNPDGPWIEIPVDTPLYLDPSSETYHSM